jgi:hypothetical protein
MGKEDIKIGDHVKLIDGDGQSFVVNETNDINATCLWCTEVPEEFKTTEYTQQLHGVVLGLDRLEPANPDKFCCCIVCKNVGFDGKPIK